jgi:transposase-like protein
MQIARNALEFQQQFKSDEDCERYLAKLRWPNGFRCPNCGHDDGYHLEGRQLVQCCVCRHQTSVTAGTIFHGTKIPLLKWFWMIFLIAEDKKGASSSRLARQLGMYQKTVWHILQKLRHAMGRRDENMSLSGFIELDQALLGPHARKTGRQKPTVEKRRPLRRGRLTKEGERRKNQTEVVVMVEQEPHAAGIVAMKVVQRATRQTIEEFVEQRVDPSQHFKTDGFQSNYVLRSMGHFHEAVVCSGAQGCVELPVVHRVIGLLKNYLLGIYHGVSARYLDRYFNEFSFRFNRRFSSKPIWFSLLNAAVDALPFTYAELKL